MNFLMRKLNTRKYTRICATPSTNIRGIRWVLSALAILVRMLVSRLAFQRAVMSRIFSSAIKVPAITAWRK